MIRKSVLLFVLFCLPFALAAQEIDSILRIYNDLFTPEKLHIQTDRSVYAKGETIFYKAYLLANNFPSTLSKTLYADWYDDKGKLLLQTETPLLIASAKGSFDIPQAYAGTTLQVKLYTKWMLNFDTAFIYSRTITVYQTTDLVGGNKVSSIKAVNSTQVQLYPEGGFSVAGLTNNIAFKATDQYGYPVNIKGTITNNHGNVLDSFTTIHDGMGIFSVVMQKDEKLFFNWNNAQHNTGVKELIPQKQAGATLHVLTKKDKAIVSIERSDDAGKEFKNMHLLIHKNETLRYKLDVDLTSKKEVQVAVDLSDLPSGIFQCTLFNASWIAVAERIAFVNNQRQVFAPTITILQKDLSKKGENKIEIKVADTALCNMSAAVTDWSLADINGPTVFSDFLLSDEIKGNVYQPAQYFLTAITPDSIAEHLDLVMLTNGHRRFDWEMIAKGVLPAISYPADTSYLQIKGQVTSKKLLRSKQSLLLNVMLQTKDSVRNMFMLPVKNDGSFEKTNMLYYDTVKLFYSINNQKNTIGSVKFNGSFMTVEERKSYFSINQISSVSSPSMAVFNINNTLPAKENIFFGEREKLQQLAASKTLKEVIVKAKIKTTTQILDDYYTRGLYSGEGNNIAVDIQGDITANGRNLWNYLQSKIPGFKAVYTPGGEIVPVWYLDSQGIPGTPDILLDEVPISVGGANDLDINSIAYVKAFRPPFLGSLQNGFSGVIAIYSKRGYSPVYSDTNKDPGLEVALLRCYSKFREFTQPDYTSGNTFTTTDIRPSVYWNPFILMDKNTQQAIISFYNNDISKKLCLVIEGVNEDGKLTRVVKMLE